MAENKDRNKSAKLATVVQTSASHSSCPPTYLTMDNSGPIHGLEFPELLDHDSAKKNGKRKSSTGKTKSEAN